MGQYEEVLTRLGFSKDPFQYPLGEQMPEDLLEETWVFFPGADKVLNLDQSTVFLAPPGSGKTTWRRYVEKRVITESEGNYLTILYNHFQVTNNTVTTLNDHRDPLLRQIARTIFDNLLADNQLIIKKSKMQANDREWWYAFLSRYLPKHYHNLIISLFPDVHTLDNVPKWGEINNFQEILLDELVPKLQSIGINRLYVFLDDLDGQLETKNPVALEALLKPLINTNQLFSDNRLVWKFFVPDSLNNVVHRSSGYKTGRLKKLPIKWNQDSLTKLLQLRLEYGSDGRIKSFEQLFFADVGKEDDPDKKILQLALSSSQLGPPRRFLQLGRHLFNRISGSAITHEEWENFKARVKKEETQLKRVVDQQGGFPEETELWLESGEVHSESKRIVGQKRELLEETIIKLKLQLEGSISPPRKKFKSRIIESSDGAEPSGYSQVPYNSKELIAILKALDDVARGRFSIGDDYSTEDIRTLGKKYKLLNDRSFVRDLLKKIGTDLYRGLLQDEKVKQVSQQTLGLSQQSEQTVLFVLRFDAHETDLARYPWELLYDGKQHIGARKPIQLVRSITYEYATTPLKVSPPVRLLYVHARPEELGFPAKEQEYMRVEQSIQSLVQSGFLEMESLHNCSWIALLDKIQSFEPHILHLDVHGQFGCYCDKCQKVYPPNQKNCQVCGLNLTKPEGFVALEKNTYAADWVSSTAMSNIFDARLRLAVISACRSSVVRGETLFGGVAPSFIRAGVPAVVGMQLPISFEDAAEFAKGFYSALSRFKSVPAAMVDGRHYLLRPKQQWFIPVLYLRSTDDEGRIFVKA